MEDYISRQVFPQAPSPTMTSLRRISAIFVGARSTGQRAYLLASRSRLDNQRMVQEGYWFDEWLRLRLLRAMEVWSFVAERSGVRDLKDS